MSQGRVASHAGSWYSGQGRDLAKELDRWLADVSEVNERGVCAVISPHAGYSYSGSTAAHGFKRLFTTRQSVKRIFILGPSHHHYTKMCLLSEQPMVETPVGNIAVDTEMIRHLKSTHGKLFDYMDKDVDEAEHSIEMQLPYIAHCMKGCKFAVVPIMVGSLNPESEAAYGRVFAPFFNDPSNFFVISSDFCHWGKRFDFTHYDKTKGEIWQSIEALDRSGMTHIENQSYSAWRQYLNTYKNTICGRFPISILLKTMEEGSQMGLFFDAKFVHYRQSSQCRAMSASSVSYASCVITKKKEKEKEGGKSDSDDLLSSGSEDKQPAKRQSIDRK